MPRSERPSGRRLGHRTAVVKPRPTRVRREPALQIVDTAEVLSEQDRAVIERDARKLAMFFDRILEIRVTVTAPHRRLHREVIRYQVRIDVAVPLEKLAVRRQEDPSLRTALQQAFSAARRQVQDYVRRHRDVPGPVEGPVRGYVIQIFPYEGYGFIEGDDGSEIYFHRNSVLDGKFGELDVGSRVRYAAEPGVKGLQASSVAAGRS